LRHIQFFIPKSLDGFVVGLVLPPPFGCTLLQAISNYTKKRKLKQFTGPSLIIRQANADIWIAGCLAEQMEVVAIEFAAFNDLNAVQSCSIMFNQFRQPRTSYIIHLLRSELEPMQLKTVNSAIHARIPPKTLCQGAVTLSTPTGFGSRRVAVSTMSSSANQRTGS